MIIAKLVFLGLFLLPVVAFGLIFHHLVTEEKSNIIASTEDWEEVGLESLGDEYEDDIEKCDIVTDPIYHLYDGNVFHDLM